MASIRHTQIRGFTLIYTPVENAEGSHQIVHNEDTITVQPDGQHSTRDRYGAIMRALTACDNLIAVEDSLRRWGYRVISDKTTQIEQVLWMLRHHRAVCATDFLDAYIPRYSARIHELRRQGYGIVTRTCARHMLHRSRQVEFELVRDPDLPTEEPDRLPPDDICDYCQRPMDGAGHDCEAP